MVIVSVIVVVAAIVAAILFSIDPVQKPIKIIDKPDQKQLPITDDIESLEQTTEVTRPDIIWAEDGKSFKFLNSEYDCVKPYVVDSCTQVDEPVIELTAENTADQPVKWTTDGLSFEYLDEVYVCVFPYQIETCDVQ